MMRIHLFNNKFCSGGKLLLPLSLILLYSSTLLHLVDGRKSNVLPENITIADETPHRLPLDTSVPPETPAAPAIPATPDGSTRPPHKPLPTVSPKDYDVLELSYALDNDTVHWPSSPGFKYKIIQYIKDENQTTGEAIRFLLEDEFSFGAKVGTHLVAPFSRSYNGWHSYNIPVFRLVQVPLHIFNLSEKVSQERDYEFKKEDFMDVAKNTSVIISGSAVLVYTGLDQSLIMFGPNAYYGINDPNEKITVKKMKIPGFSKEAAEYLVSLDVYGVGVDAPAVDSSKRHLENGSVDAIAQQIFADANIYVLQNLGKEFRQIIRKSDSEISSYRLTTFPLPVRSSSGSPCRVVASKCLKFCSGPRYGNAVSFGLRPSPTVLITSLPLLIVFLLTIKPI